MQYIDQLCFESCQSVLSENIMDECNKLVLITYVKIKNSFESCQVVLNENF